jgi:dihydrofolate reductase
MAALRYFVRASLDGFIADRTGNFDWAAPDEEVHGFVNDRMRDVGTYLYGRRMWDTMRYWQTAPDSAGTEPVAADFARIWRAAEKIVYSATLTELDSPHTRLRSRFDAGEVAELIATADADVAVGGAGLAAYALRAGLVDEIEFLAVPVLVGGGTHWLPPDLRLDLELLDEHRFASGSVDLRYRVRR